MSTGWRSATNANFDSSATPTSRAMNVTATKAEVIALCERRHATISAIEPLLSGGTRVVLSNADDAAVIRKALKAKLIDGNVKRTMWVRNS